MKITHNKVGQNINLTDTGKADKTAKAGKTKILSGDPKAAAVADALNLDSAKASNVHLSERAVDAKRAKDIAMAAPDIREDRVAELQKRIDEGKYSVDAKDIADKMVDEEVAW